MLLTHQVVELVQVLPNHALGIRVSRLGTPASDWLEEPLSSHRINSFILQSLLRFLPHKSCYVRPPFLGLSRELLSASLIAREAIYLTLALVCQSVVDVA